MDQILLSATKSKLFFYDLTKFLDASLRRRLDL